MDHEKDENALKTIGEVSEILNLPQHVVRFWESKFDFLTPTKRRGRRYYDAEDIENLFKIKTLLYKKGLTIKGVQQHFTGQPIEQAEFDFTSKEEPIYNQTSKFDFSLESLLAELVYVRDKLKAL